ncbi:GNAT family acetyltransferase [Nostocales cyanobacterium HT-58-2]|nr:GNAT family acetyltransferase [Nostocales cyanobacterium HT-58-2]
MNIRLYQESDAKSVSDLWNEVFPENPQHNAPTLVITKKLKVQPELFFVAEKDCAIIGTIMAGYDGHRGWLYTVAVSPQYRRQGIGSQLVQHAESALSTLGCPKINLQVRASNAGVVAFYERLGYVIEERISMGKLIK